MKQFIYFAIGCLSVFASAQAREFPIQEIFDMNARDEEARKIWVKTRNIAEVRAQEVENTARLKEILDIYGLPDGYEIEDLVEAVETLVLRSSDLEFQEQFLEKVKFAGDLWAENLNPIEDRVRIRRGLPQLYGTHFYHEDNQFVPYPIEDVEKLDENQKQKGEPPFAYYLQMMQSFDRQLEGEVQEDLHKILFNMQSGFYEKPEDYLYYATFYPNEQPRENGSFLAFEDPSLAVCFALSQKSLFVDGFYEKDADENSYYFVVACNPQSPEDATLLAQTPMYIYLIPRTTFELHEPYNDFFLNRVFISSVEVSPVAEIKCDTAIEPIILTGSKLKVSGNGAEFTHRETSFRETIQEALYFDTTLENEQFDAL